MPVLPLVDLFILLATACFGTGFVMKALEITTTYHPSILGFSSIDFALMGVLCLLFVLTLVGRTWLKLNEPLLLAANREATQIRARERARQLQEANGPLANGALQPSAAEQAEPTS